MLFTGIGGEYPLNDDWIYSSGVKSLLVEGKVAYYSPVAPNLILQVVCGWLFCVIGGEFSFVLLRLSTLFLSGLGLIAFYQLIKVITANKKIAFAGGLLLLANPIFYNLSFSFMTDIPFTALIIVSLWQYALYYKKKRFWYRIAGALAAIAAFGVRQPGIMLWMAAEVVILLNSRSEGKTNYFSIFSLVSSVGLFLLMEYGIKSYLIGSSNYLQPSDATILAHLWKGIFEFVKRCGMAFFYVGLFGIPFIPYVLHKTLSEKWWKSAWFAGVAVFNVMLIWLLARQGFIYPFGGHTIYNLGLGTPLLFDFHHWRFRAFPHIPSGIVMGVGYLLQLYTFLLFKLLIDRFLVFVSNSRLSTMDWTVLLFTIPYTCIVFFWGFFDRYVLTLFIVVLYFIVRLDVDLLSLGRSQLVILMAMLCYSVAGTKDYLSWNNTVLHKKNEILENTKVDRASISAGYAQDGWDNQGLVGIDRYTLLFTWGKVDNYLLLDSIHYVRLLPGRGIIYLVKNDN